MTERCSIWAAAAGALLAAVLACARADAGASSDSVRADSIARAVQDSANRAQPGYVVDSIFPADEEIRRFNADLDAPAALTGGGASRAELVRRFVAAMQQYDTTALRSLLVTRAEFAYFVFPESPYTRPPYKTKPVVIWTQLLSDSERGLQRLLGRAAGPAMKLSNLQCAPAPERQGANLYWRDCSVFVRTASGAAQRMRLFGNIMERGGRAKFLSYANDF